MRMKVVHKYSLMSGLGGCCSPKEDLCGDALSQGACKLLLNRRSAEAMVVLIDTLKTCTAGVLACLVGHTVEAVPYY